VTTRDDDIFVQMLLSIITLRSVVTSLLAVLFALATTGLPVVVSYCCDVPIAATAAVESDPCCESDCDCCETEVVVNKVDGQSVAQESHHLATPVTDVIAILPLESVLAVQRHSLQWLRVYEQAHPPGPPEQPMLAVFLI
jgi:hypothetical protein